MNKKTKRVPTTVVEHDHAFLHLFPHRFDFLWASHPLPGISPNWQTESRYPLGDRLILEGDKLYGVRFAKTTRYVMLDIDRESLYHPANDPLAIPRIQGVLEQRLDLVASVMVQSSYSGGLHIYFPFEEPVPSWELGNVVSALLESAGFSVTGGQLEVFPNRRPFSSDNQLALFNGHRLPLQAGSYLLNNCFEPVCGEQDAFVHAWHLAQEQNTFNATVLRTVAQSLRKPYPQVSKKAAKFLNDLNTEIEEGWTGQQQTNRLLGRITMRTYIFGEVLYGLKLTGKALVDKIVDIARASPGFAEFSKDVEIISKRAWEWARSIEASKYYPYRTKRATNTQDSGPTWNERQYDAARRRIMDAVTRLEHSDTWPEGATARVNLLVKESGASKTTLYKHKDLWHPSTAIESVSEGECAVGATPSVGHTSLLGCDGCNPISDKESEAAVKGPKDLLGVIRQGFKQRQANQQQEQASRQLQLVFERSNALWEQMMDYLQSGDPILMREAEGWFERQHSQGKAYGTAYASE